MTNIRQFKVKPKITRNQMALDVVRNIRKVVDSEDDIIDYVLVAIEKNTPAYVIHKSLGGSDEYNPLPLIGALELAKMSLMSALGFEDAEEVDEE